VFVFILLYSTEVQQVVLKLRWSLLQGNIGFDTLSLRRKNPMSSKGCWMLRRKVGRAMELEAMTTFRARFPLGIFLMHAKFYTLEDAHEVFDEMPQQDDHGPL
jgi:hypothetical protein